MSKKGDGKKMEENCPWCGKKRIGIMFVYKKKFLHMECIDKMYEIAKKYEITKKVV